MDAGAHHGAYVDIDAAADGTICALREIGWVSADSRRCALDQDTWTPMTHPRSILDGETFARIAVGSADVGLRTRSRGRRVSLSG